MAPRPSRTEHRESPTLRDSRPGSNQRSREPSLSAPRTGRGVWLVA
eukprot:CAMPEP_0184392354 /NCGR_PEP_ID=MMETSP0007-20130409/26864_1 /TAXON_ID=97485 /ORGANISM="Prymnesium parvum, Strain Texoma1" /LENGTH=45 /DNA_ID= /DNA_START= /DNA_END= /DNA_ORIENTATION=